MSKRETYPEYVRRKEAENPGDKDKREAGKALARKKIGVPAKGKNRGER
jgi:hypothetical protein